MTTENNPYLSLIDNDVPVKQDESSTENPYLSLISKEENIPEKKDVKTNQSFNVNNLMNAGIGAGTGFVAGPTLERMMAEALTPTKNEPKRTYYNPRGRSVEESIENRRNYMDAQHEQDLGIRRKTEMAKKYPNYRPAVPEEPPKSIAQKIVSPLEAMGQKLGIVGNVIGKTAGPRLGGALALGSGAYDVSDAINRYQNNDPYGALISGAGAVGSGLAMLPPVSLPTAVLKGAGATMATVSPFAMMLHDYLRNRAVKEGMAQQPQQSQQPSQQPPQQ